MLAKAIVMYNDIRPHSSLKRLSPSNFETQLTKNSFINKREKEAKKEKVITIINYSCKPLKTVNVI